MVSADGGFLSDAQSSILTAFKKWAGLQNSGQSISTERNNSASGHSYGLKDCEANNGRTWSYRADGIPTPGSILIL